jgi:hypothetical protein
VVPGDAGGVGVPDLVAGGLQAALADRPVVDAEPVETLTNPHPEAAQAGDPLDHRTLAA